MRRPRPESTQGKWAEFFMVVAIVCGIIFIGTCSVMTGNYRPSRNEVERIVQEKCR